MENTDCGPHVVLMLHVSFVEGYVTAGLPAVTCCMWTDLFIGSSENGLDLWQMQCSVNVLQRERCSYSGKPVIFARLSCGQERSCAPWELWMCIIFIQVYKMCFQQGCAVHWQPSCTYISLKGDVSFLYSNTKNVDLVMLLLFLFPLFQHTSSPALLVKLEDYRRFGQKTELF